MRNALFVPDHPVLLLLTVLLWPSLAISEDSVFTRASLRELEGVYVLVEGIDPEAEIAGLTNNQVQTDVELRLRKAGMKVLTEAEWLVTEGGPFLYTRVSTVESEMLYAFTIDVKFSQRVILKRNPRIVTGATTWDISKIGLTSRSRFSRFVRDSLADLVDTFINAYLAVNPK